MGFTLAVDRGNSAVKIAVYEGNRLMDTFSAPVLDEALLTRVSAVYGKPEGIAYSTVGSGAEAEMALLRALTPRLLRLTPDTPLPLALDYSATLGPDRIAAAVGAATLFPGTPLLVVDAGTAVTYDVVTADGRFAGGNIAPGLKMRLDALHRFTAALPALEVPDSVDPDSPFGHDTASAMVCGAVFGIVGAIEGYLKRLPADTRVVMTGGSARLLARVADTDVEVVPHLVTFGLNSILLYNNEHLL